MLKHLICWFVQNIFNEVKCGFNNLLNDGGKSGKVKKKSLSICLSISLPYIFLQILELNKIQV